MLHSPDPIDSARAVGAVRSVADAVRSAEMDDVIRQRYAVRVVARSAGPILEARRESVSSALRAAVDHAAHHGFPPPVLSIVGRQDRETPLNRLLRWILDPHASHGAGDLALRRLVAFLDLPELLEDLDDGDEPEVRGETIVPGDDVSGDLPDILVLTRRCALLVENKVWSRESGANQYERYRLALERVSTAGRPHTWAWLTARDRRETPEGWAGTKTHAELSTVFWRCGAVLRAEHPGSWAGSSLHVVAHALSGEMDRRPALKEATELLAAGRLTAADMAKAERLVRELTPWSTT